MTGAGNRRLLPALIVIVRANARYAGEERGHAVLVYGGAFIMSTPESMIGDLGTRYRVSFPGSLENEIHAHEVTRSSLRMGRHEVTNARFADFVAARPEWGPDRRDDDLQWEVILRPRPDFMTSPATRRIA